MEVLVDEDPHALERSLRLDPLSMLFLHSRFPFVSCTLHLILSIRGRQVHTIICSLCLGFTTLARLSLRLHLGVFFLLLCTSSRGHGQSKPIFRTNSAVLPLK